MTNDQEIKAKALDLTVNIVELFSPRERKKFFKAAEYIPDAFIKMSRHFELHLRGKTSPSSSLPETGRDGSPAQLP